MSRTGLKNKELFLRQLFELGWLAIWLIIAIGVGEYGGPGKGKNGELKLSHLTTMMKGWRSYVGRPWRRVGG